jgi:hypothetical protein
MRTHVGMVTACGLLLLAAGGCGGGGAGTPVHPLSSVLRSYRVGDQWVYSVVGTWKGALASDEIPMHGTVTRSMGTLTMAGSDYLGITVFQNLLPQSGMYQERRYTLLRQDAAARLVREVGDKLDQGYWRMVIDDPEPVLVPGAWTVGYSHDTTTRYENGERSTHTLSIGATETVVIPVGSFETYRVVSGEDDPKYGTSTRTEWWHPGLGAPVRYTDRRQMPGGITIIYTATLASTTVAVD